MEMNMNMNRRKFMQGLAALVGGGMAARIAPLDAVEVVAEAERILEDVPVTRTEPLAWVELDGRKYALVDCRLDWWRNPIEVLTNDSWRTYMPGATGWELDCALAADESASAVDLFAGRPIEMRVRPNREDALYQGRVYVTSYATSMWLDGDVVQHLTLQGSGDLVML